ncbi:PTS sugar transporter subunit IIC [Clostridium fungisolvens]|uniref:Permease IIC component n=1 Tax=Clostridium fungisolvens TaxID=1604897 RepID=A0A6V8SIH6_9CLOT|nr:PTS transporter subunit EIIC [Clostridium fungisolvens]GFP74673.1 Lichenan permease IIC component [Clostridium fungisolvens]
MSINVQGIQQKIQPVVNKLSNNRYLKAMMGGMMAGMPATIIGSLATLLKSLPIAPYQSFITSHGIDKYLQLPVILTTNILALIFVVCITYTLAESFDVKGIGPAIIALVSFLVLTPLQTAKTAYGTDATLIPMDWLGSTGVFTALIVAFVVGRLYVAIVQRGWTIKMPESVPPFIKDSFASLVPGTIITTIFIVISAVFANTPFGSVHAFIYGILQLPLQHLGGSFGTLVFVAILSQVLWAFGIHGSMVVLSVMMPIWGAMDAAQLSAYSAGKPLPNIVGMMFFTIYTFGGTALGLAIVMLKAKSERFKTLGRLSIVPAIFGITEPIIFGTPLVLNPIFVIPFVFGNVISLVLAYVSTIIGIIPPPNGIGAPSGTPIVLQGLIAGGWRNAIFQVVLVILWVVLWYPFFKIADKKALEEETVVVQQ